MDNTQKQVELVVLSLYQHNVPSVLINNIY